MGKLADLNTQIKNFQDLLGQRNKELAELVNLNGPGVAERSDQIINDICYLEECLNDLITKRSQETFSPKEQAEIIMGDLP